MLNKLAKLSQELETIFDVKFKTSVDSLSKATIRLTLLCHSVGVFQEHRF